ncbi:MAG: hypothetical protein P4N59_17910 [Negativicutes bacterium]|nr:hypothetical protein [Negativicutes bacterium]
MELFFLLIILFCLVWYVFICYLIYRIVAKFDDTTTFGECLIPFYNWYLVISLAVNQPGLYFMSMILVIVVTAFANSVLQDDLFDTLRKCALFLMNANVWGLVARRLGKRFWLHALLALIPITFIILMTVAAFDKSRADHPSRVAEPIAPPEPAPPAGPPPHEPPA